MSLMSWIYLQERARGVGGGGVVIAFIGKCVWKVG